MIFDFKEEIFIILCWIGVWGIVETIIHIYISANNFKARIYVYISILTLAVLFRYYWTHMATN